MQVPASHVMQPDISPLPLQQEITLLYRDHHGWLQGWLRGKLGNAGDAADLAQDTFVQVISAANAQEVHEPRAYLIVIAKRLMFNFWRRRDLEQAYLNALAALPEEFAPSQEDRLIVLEALAQVDLMLASLPEKSKQVFLLNQLHEMTYVEIAAQLGMPVITVRRHMKRALQACMQLEH